MSSLTKLTITGADSTTDIDWMVSLSEAYPFLEWGILLTNLPQGGPRFPDWEWLYQLQQKKPPTMRLSLHLCGHVMRKMLLGENQVQWLFAPIYQDAQRLQLNFHGDLHQFDPTKFTDLMVSISNTEQKQIIFQMDGTANEGLFEWALRSGANAVPLFDQSHGTGKLPEVWPLAVYTKPDGQPVMHGYAGGLGPDNLERQLGVIEEAADGKDYWIDMETQVRLPNDRGLDTLKVWRVVDFVAGFMGR